MSELQCVAGLKIHDGKLDEFKRLIAHAWGGHPPGQPCFIVTHTIPAEWEKPGSPFIFVTDGVESAIRQAQQAAGDKNVVIATASILQQALKAGLVRETLN